MPPQNDILLQYSKNIWWGVNWKGKMSVFKYYIIQDDGDARI